MDVSKVLFFEERKYVFLSIYKCEFPILACGFTMINKYNQLKVFFQLYVLGVAVLMYGGLIYSKTVLLDSISFG